MRYTAVITAVALVLAGTGQAVAAEPPEHLGEGRAVGPRLAGSPPAAAKVASLAMAGPRLVTTDAQSRQLYETSDNGVRWTATGGSSTRPVELQGTTLLSSDGTSTLVRTSAGQLTFPAADDVVLGQGGRLVAHRTGESAEVLDASSGQKLADLAPPFALAGTTAWKVTEPGVLTGQDVVAGSSRTILVASGCAVGPGAVNGSWALLTGCAGGDQVIDVSGPEAPRFLTVPPGSQLGNGFVAQLVDGQDATGTRDLLVTDLNDPALGQRRYGPLPNAGATFRADGAGATTIAYAGPDGQPRIITLSWLKDYPRQRPDSTPPLLTTASAGDRVRDIRTATFGWTFVDPADDPYEPATGVRSYDVRIQQRPAPGAAYGAWREVAGWQGIGITEVSLTADPGIDTCWQVRSRDNALNLSGWSSSYCTETDGTAPVHVSSRPGDRVVLTPAQQYSYAFTDNLDPVTYDVAYRGAGPGQALGPWVYPAVWQQLQQKSVGWAANAGSDRCFMVRARDVIGNVSAWSPQTCSVLPQDDRALTATGSVTRAADPAAFQGTTSVLNTTGAALSKTGEAGTRIALVTLNGPGQGRVDVYHAGTRIASVSLAAASRVRKVTYLPVTAYRTGEVRVVSTGTAPAAVDGIAFLRVNP